MDPHLERALLLLDQSRYELAEAELRGYLSDNPNDANAHAILALCLSEGENLKEATAEAEAAIAMAPDASFGHYALASVMFARNQPRPAFDAISEAIRIDPDEPDYFALLSSIQLSLREWSEALRAAEKGLEIDSEHDACTNLRSIALVQLGRNDEAGEAIESALGRDPENSVTHANQGWAMLHRGEFEPALDHFRESLRLDPENPWARDGVVHALKARYAIYALILRYFLWMSRLSRGAQWGIILGGWFANRMLANLAASNPSIAPFVLPFNILYLAFVVLSWTAEPLFNLMLRLNRYGRMVLDDEEILASNFVGGCLFGGLGLLALAAITGSSTLFASAIVVGLLLLPVAGVFGCPDGWPRTVMTVGTVVIALIGVGAVYNIAITPDAMSEYGVSAGLMGIFFMGIFIATIGGNALSSVRVKT